MSKPVRVYFKMNQQVIEFPNGLFPPAVRAMIAGGTATILEDGKPSEVAEVAALDPAQERAVTAAQNVPKKKK